MEDYKYTAIIDWTVNYIKDNHLKPDDKFFTENERCTMHNVSRQTVRQALMKLESDNVIKRVRGSGTFVSGGIPCSDTDFSRKCVRHRYLRALGL